MTDFKGLLRALTDANVATNAREHRAARSGAGAARSVSPWGPARATLPLDSATVERGLNFTLTSDVGDLDLFGEIAGGGTYDALRPHAVTIQVFEVECLCLGLERLIDVKRAAGRPKDQEAVAKLEAILEERRGLEQR